ALVHVQHADAVADRGQAGPRDQSHVAGTEDGDLQTRAPREGPDARGSGRNELHDYPGELLTATEPRAIPPGVPRRATRTSLRAARDGSGTAPGGRPRTGGRAREPRPGPARTPSPCAEG